MCWPEFDLVLSTMVLTLEKEPPPSSDTGVQKCARYDTKQKFKFVVKL